MRDERRGTRDEGRGRRSSIVPASKASGRPSSLVMVLLALLILLTSCGYRLGGTGGLVPEGARSISIPVFVNGTNEPYVDTEVTKAVVNEFLTDGRLQVVGLESADLALYGKVTKYDVVALSYTENSDAQQYRVMLTVEARLEDRRTKKILWEEKGIESVFISDYAVVYDPLIDQKTGKAVIDPKTGKVIYSLANIKDTKIGKDAAIQKASKDIALTLRSRVLEGF